MTTRMKDIETMLRKVLDEMYHRLLLERNMEKGTWFTMTNEQIMARIKEELDELRIALYCPEDKKIICEEAADICNFLGFLIDNQSREVLK